MIAHKYINASDNIAQYEADQCGREGRQEVTIDWYMQHMCGFDVFVWLGDEIAEMGLDPWRLNFDLDAAQERGLRIFVQRKDMPEALRTKRHDPMAAFRISRDTIAAEHEAAAIRRQGGRADW